jgi:hypothetical protein
VREGIEQVGERVRLEHRAIRARLDLGRALRAHRLVRGLAGDGGGIDVGRAPRCLLGEAGTSLVGSHDERARVCHPLLDGDAGRRRDGKLGDRTGEEAVHRDFGSVDRRRRESRLVVRPERCGCLVVALDFRRVGGSGEAGEGLVLRRTARRIRGALRKLREPVAVELVRRGDADACALDDAESDDGVLDQRRLVYLRAGEAREAGAFRVGDGFGVSVRGCERRARDFERAHDFTPTWTLRKRAGEAPCETCALCPGCPLPQFVRP